MLHKIIELVGPKLGQASLTVKNYAPELYLIGGIAAGVASVVMVAKAHAKAEDVFADVVEDREETQQAIEDLTDEDGLEITGGEKFGMLAPHYREFLVRGLKLYGPGVLMGISGVALVLGSHGLLRGRNRSLVTTVAILQQGFMEYRKRVTSEYGKEAEERIFFGADSRKVTTLEVDEDGKTKKRKSTKNHIPEEPNPLMYSRIFDETNNRWDNNPEVLHYWLGAVQQQMNDRLFLQGYVVLNTVYEALGFSESPEGAVVGWSNSMPGDDYISFGLDNDINEREGDNRYFLDFNVNGVMFELIGAK